MGDVASGRDAENSSCNSAGQKWQLCSSAFPHSAAEVGVSKTTGTGARLHFLALKRTAPKALLQLLEPEPLFCLASNITLPLDAGGNIGLLV